MYVLPQWDDFAGGRHGVDLRLPCAEHACMRMFKVTGAAPHERIKAPNVAGMMVHPATVIPAEAGIHGS